MGKLKVAYNQNYWTNIELERTKTEVQTHAPFDNSPGDSFSPTDLVVGALGSCVLTTIAMGAEKYGFDVDGMSMEVEKIMQNKPRLISEVNMKIVFPQAVHYSEKEKIMIERIAKSCVVTKSLHPDMKKNIEFIYTK